MRDAELKQYQLHAKMPVYKRHVEHARELIREATEQHPGVWAAGISGGKDSMVATHLAHATGWRGPALHFVYRETPEENTSITMRLCQCLGLELHIIQVPGAWDVYDRVGHFFVEPETQEERQATNWMLNGYKKTVSEYVEKQRWTGMFWGMRGDESKVRSITLARKTPIYKAASRSEWTCCPLARWTGRDVWAYIVTHQLPYLSVYDDQIDRDRERQRSEMTWLACPSLWRYGRAQGLRQRNPELWVSLCAKWPGLSAYG